MAIKHGGNPNKQSWIEAARLSESDGVACGKATTIKNHTFSRMVL